MLHEQKVKGILATALPAFSVTSIRKLAEGWDNVLFLVNDHLVVRCCKRKFAIPFVELEINVLPFVQDRLSLPVPRILHTGILEDIYPFFSYEVLPGAMASDLYLEETERALLVKPLAAFMHRLHTIPVTEEVRRLIPPDQIGRLDIPKRSHLIRDKLYVTEKLGIPFDRSLAEELIASVTRQEVAALQTIVHGDLHSRNILVNGRSHISGIIDWSDVHIGNPAKDLGFAVNFFPPPLFSAFRDHYPGLHLPLFRLAAFAALSLTTSLTEYALDINDAPLIAECKRSFINIQNNYTVCRAWDR